MNFLILIGLAALPVLGCGNPSNLWESRGDRVLGIGSDRAEDPVSGSMVAKDKAVERAYLRTIYYFESSRTAATFMQNPDNTPFGRPRAMTAAWIAPMSARAPFSEIPR
jgi:YHS domain-containing protein